MKVASPMAYSGRRVARWRMGSVISYDREALDPHATWPCIPSLRREVSLAVGVSIVVLMRKRGLMVRKEGGRCDAVDVHWLGAKSASGKKSALKVSEVFRTSSTPS